MLLVEKFFKTFTKKEICDTSKNTEVIVALSAESREKVDQMINKAIESGGSEPREAQDHGWMYGRSFEDIGRRGCRDYLGMMMHYPIHKFDIKNVLMILYCIPIVFL